VEGVSISANESWDFSKLVELEVLLRDTLSRLGLDNLEIDVVGLCNCTNGSRAGVALQMGNMSARCHSKTIERV
jgi:hypothetical protein